MGASRITLLTDFGTVDGYVGEMKGLLAERVPGVLLDDVSHSVRAGDIRGAMWALGRYWRRYPPGTVHLVVVDPGVGTGRMPLALEADGRFVVAPDNGVVTHVLTAADSRRCVEIRGVEPPGEPSATFHGRDVFAPAAAVLAGGRSLSDLGPPLEAPVELTDPEPVREEQRLRGEVVHVDRFGNLVTNLPGSWLSRGAVVEVRERRIPLVTTYGDAAPGELLALVGSSDRLEIAERDGSAAERLGSYRGDPVRVELEPQPG